jgi:hypothetical protein
MTNVKNKKVHHHQYHHRQHLQPRFLPTETTITVTIATAVNIRIVPIYIRNNISNNVQYFLVNNSGVLVQNVVLSLPICAMQQKNMASLIYSLVVVVALIVFLLGATTTTIGRLRSIRSAIRNGGSRTIRPIFRFVIVVVAGILFGCFRTLLIMKTTTICITGSIPTSTTTMTKKWME